MNDLTRTFLIMNIFSHLFHLPFKSLVCLNIRLSNLFSDNSNLRFSIKVRLGYTGSSVWDVTKVERYSY